MRTDIFIIRHAEAEDREEWRLSDELRPLTAKGRKKFDKFIAKRAKQFGSTPLILTSPALRTVQTAEIVHAHMSEAEIVRLDALLPGASVETAYHALDLVNYSSLVLVGHEPQLSALAWYLMTGETRLCALKVRKGSILHLRARVVPKPSHFFLYSMETPR